jgi:serine/threonine-protein kinase
MAPEQAAGATDVLDGRADVYALGATLYEILAREPLHGQDSIQGLLRATLSGPSPPVEQRPSIERIPPELLGLLRRATAIEPKNRVPTARELADAVERFLDGERDEVRRRELADAHVARAQSLADAASTRIEALREVGRALALDPANTAALTLLRELFSLPEEDAGEALPELEALEHERRQGLLRVVRVRALAWLAAVPFFVAMGVTNVARLGVVAGLVAANAMLATVLARRPRVTDAMLRLSLVASTVCVTSFGLFYGPLILTPVYAVTNAIVYAMSGERRLRWEAIALSSAALVVPVLASLSGLDVTYYASNRVDGFTVWSPTLEVPLEATMAVLCAAFIATTITPSLLIGRMTQQLASAERRVALQAHRLRQLLPPS